MAHILVVDDWKEVANVIAEIFDAVGHTTEVAYNGAQAWNLFQQSPEKYDLIITDKSMAPIDGPGLIKLVKGVRPNQKIILMSSDHEPPEHGADRFVEKPINIFSEAFTKAIADVLS